MNESNPVVMAIYQVASLVILAIGAQLADRIKRRQSRIQKMLEHNTEICETMLAAADAIKEMLAAEHRHQRETDTNDSTQS